MISFEDKIIYQIYPRSFMDSNGDGFGDLGGVTQKLDYLKELGVDYLWLTPFFVSPQRDNGYDISSYTEIDPRFGTMEDFENLVREAKKRGLGLMLDMVFNHTSTQHPWFQRALSGDKKYQDYYIFKEGAEPPTNWQSKFGGSAWEYCRELKKWYLHLFDVSQADLNWENPDLRKELRDIVLFWKNKGVEGFRFDVINLISKPRVFSDDRKGDGRRFYTDGPKVHEYIRELVAETQIGDYITVGEMSSTDIENCIRYSNPSQKELSMCFHFQHLKIDYKDGEKWILKKPDLSELKKLFKVWQEGMEAGGGHDALFWCNHDQPRIVSRLGDEDRFWEESAKMLGGMIHLMRGTPYIYQGEEIGMTNPHFNRIDQYKDVESLNYYDILLREGKTRKEALEILGKRSRDDSRTPMQWSDEDFGGFSKTQPWIDMADNYKIINVRKQRDEPDSILSFYKELIALRKKRKVIAKGSIFFRNTKENVLVYERILEQEKIMVFCNLTDQPVETEGYPGKARKLIGNYPDTVVKDKILSLRPYEFLSVEIL